MTESDKSALRNMIWEVLDVFREPEYRNPSITREFYTTIFEMAELPHEAYAKWEKDLRKEEEDSQEDSA